MKDSLSFSPGSSQDPQEHGDGDGNPAGEYCWGQETTSELYLLQVAQHVSPAVKHAPAFRGVQVVQELRGVVFVALLVPVEAHKAVEAAPSPGSPGQWDR